MTPRVTLVELLDVVNEFAATDDEAVATIVHMVNSGAVDLIGIARPAAELSELLAEVA